MMVHYRFHCLFIITISHFCACKVLLQLFFFFFSTRSKMHSGVFFQKFFLSFVSVFHLIPLFFSSLFSQFGMSFTSFRSRPEHSDLKNIFGKKGGNSKFYDLPLSFSHHHIPMYRKASSFSVVFIM